MLHVSFTSHIGHGQHENKTKGTALNTVSDLAQCEKHNNHNYSQSDVEHIASYIDLSLKQYNKHYDQNLNELDYFPIVDKVRQAYEREFAEAIEKHNALQIEKGKPDRCITDYLEKISNTKNQEVAVEGIIQIGKYENWKNSTIEEKLKIVPILERGLEVIRSEVPGFKLVGASLHLDEYCPHIQYIGICVADTPGKALEKRIKKSAVFTKDILSNVLQDRMRAVMQPLIEKEFNWTFEEKTTGRNEDLEKNVYLNKQLQHENELLKAQVEHMQAQSVELTQAFNNLETKVKELTAPEPTPIEAPTQNEINFIMWCLERLKGVKEAVLGFCYKKYNEFKKMREIENMKARERISNEKESLLDKIKGAQAELDRQPTDEGPAAFKDDRDIDR